MLVSEANLRSIDAAQIGTVIEHSSTHTPLRVDEQPLPASSIFARSV